MIDYTLNRSKRKTVALYVRDGCVEVRAPLKMPKHIIDQFVVSKEKWIEEKLAIMNERTSQRDSFTLDYDSEVLYRGNLYPIVAREGDYIGFDDDCFYMPQGLSHEQIKSCCIDIYKMVAKRDILIRTMEIAQKMSAYPQSVKITDARSRWGSCSASKRICFSWRLIMADDDLIEYIIVHELSHLTELNHSDRFWNIVESILPDYKDRQNRLKELHEKLASENW